MSGSGAELSTAATGTHLDVGHLVVVEVTGSSEALAADSALVGLLAAVDAPVGVEAGAGAEALAADVTHMRLLAWRRREKCGVSRRQPEGEIQLRPECTMQLFQT